MSELRVIEGDVAFFGCWSGPDGRGKKGHFLYDRSGMSADAYGPFMDYSLDGVLLGKGQRIPGQVDVVHFREYTVIAFEDFSVDQRPGSNGAFVVRGNGLTRKECWRIAENGYPHIVARLRMHLRMGDD